MENIQLKFLTNKITVRWLSILKILERERNCSVQKIATITQMSDRTIVKEIKHIRDYFGDTIKITTNNLGYLFVEQDLNEYNGLKRNLVNEDPIFIILQSILEGKLKSVEEWSFEFHLSESTMNRYLLSVSPILSEYAVKFSLTPVDLIGKEVNIRKFLKDFYYEVDVIPHTLLPFHDMKDFINILEVEQLKLKVDISASDFRYFLYIMIQRSKQGRESDSCEIQFNYTQKELYFLNKLKEEIDRFFDHKLSDKELMILYIYCMTQRRITVLETEIEYCARFSHTIEGLNLSEKLISSYNDKLFTSKIDITYFVESFFISIKLLNSIGAIMNKNQDRTMNFTKRVYPLEFDIAFKFMKEYQSLLKIDRRYIEDISASLVLLMESIIDSYLKNSRNIAFLIDCPHYLKQAIHSKILRYLGAYHQIFFPTMGDLTKFYFERHQIDLFVTNQEEYTIEFYEGMDCMLFKSLPDTSDWNKLLNYINPRIIQDLSFENVVQLE